MHEDASDEELIAVFCKTGNFAVFETVHRRNHRPLLKHLLGRIRSLATAEDIAQEAWTKVIAAIRHNGYEVRADARFRAFLFRVADNCRIDHHRREKIRPVELLPAGDGDDPSDPSSAIDVVPDATADGAIALHRKRLLEKYGDFLATLPPEQREALHLNALGHTVEEAARIAGVLFETMKSRLRYARPKLEAWLAQQRLELDGCDD